MTVTVDDLAQHLGFATTPSDTEMLERALGAARGIIWPHLISNVRTLRLKDAFAPDAVAVLDSCVLTVAADEWRRKDTGSGTFQFADGTDQVARLPYDQLRAVWPKLLEAGLVELVVA